MEPHSSHFISCLMLFFACFFPLGSSYIADNFRGFINDPEGVAFKPDNGKYLAMNHTRQQRGEAEGHVGAYDLRKGPTTRFLVREDGGSVYLECLPRTGRDLFLENVGTRRYPDEGRNVKCVHHPSGRGIGLRNKYDVHSVGDGSKVALRSVFAPQKFLGTVCSNERVCRQIDQVYANRPQWYKDLTRDKITPGFNNIRPATSFAIESAALIPTTLELIDATFDDVNGQLQAVNTPPVVAKSASLRNSGGSTLTHTFTMDHVEEIVETTNWERHFGAALTLSYTTPPIASLLAGQMSFQASLSYDYRKGGTSSVKTTKRFSETVTVHIPPSSAVTVKLMIRKKTDAAIPFQAKFKKISFDQNSGVRKETVISERGTWRGVLWLDTNVIVNTTPIV